MPKLEDLQRGAQVRGILPNAAVTVVDVQWHGSNVIELTYKAKLPNGASDSLQRTVSENCCTLHFDQHGFEEE